MSDRHIGEVVQVTGPVLDIRFAHDELPALLNAIEIDNKGAKLTAEVDQAGKDVQAVIDCGMPTEQVYRSLEEIPDDAGYFALVIAKEPK